MDLLGPSSFKGQQKSVFSLRGLEMKIIIEEKALVYIREKGIEEAYIKSNLRASCGVGGLISPRLQRGRPKHEAMDFHVYQEKGLKLYVPSFIRWEKQEIKISLEKILGIKSLIIENPEEGK